MAAGTKKRLATHPAILIAMVDHRTALEKMVAEGQDYDTIRKAAEHKGLKGTELKETMRAIDHLILVRDAQKAERNGGIEIMIVGLALLAIATTIYLFNQNILDPRFKYFIWGCWGGGSILILKGIQQYRA